MKFSDPSRDPTAVRVAAAELSGQAGLLDHEANNDERAPYIFSFTKGLGHEQNGLLSDPADFEAFAAGTLSHDPAVFAGVDPYRGTFRTETIGGLPDWDVYRQWESPTCGHAYVLEGPDPYAVTMPPAPPAGSAEFAAEMAEVYQMALCRDWPIAAFMPASLVNALTAADGSAADPAKVTALQAGNGAVVAAATRLSNMRWFRGTTAMNDVADPLQQGWRRCGTPQTAANVFRGQGEDGWDTPFLSQFMIMGTGGNRANGLIAYGAQTIDQRVTVALPEKDYMTDWEAWLDVQNGLDKRGFVRERDEEYQKDDNGFDARRTMARLRDMATYVHDDQLYQAYLNAALILLAEKYAFDPGIPFHRNTSNPARHDNREPFALFGGPHLLTLVTEVSSRALKAVRLQKFTVHRRLRPEAAGALFHTIYSGYQPDRGLAGSTPYAETGNRPDAEARRQLGRTLATYTFDGVDTEAGFDPTLADILEDIREHNDAKNGTGGDLDQATWLLPMAFPEGSPMHPAYGAGHATVAGACVTLLKAFFAMTQKAHPTKPVYLVDPGETALVPDGGATAEDTDIEMLGVAIPRGLTLEGELNKLMWNISNARNIAGVHYYTDYIESALLGEAITIGILREQMLAYHPGERVEMTVPLLVPRTLPACLLNGSTIGATEVVGAVKILSDGTLAAAQPTPGRC